MSRIYLFRGMMGTGKTEISDLLAEKLKVPVFRKEDIYETIDITAFDHQKKKRNGIYGAYKICSGGY